MIKTFIWGIGGKMGNYLSTLAIQDKEIEFVGGFDKFASPESFKFRVFNDIENCDIKPDVIIDFSRPEALDDVITFAKKKKCGVVFATTGYSDSELKKIDDFSKELPAFRTFNFSLGINLLEGLVKKAVSFLGSSYDIEIIEKHHNQKIDSPSGTAIMLANAINEAAENSKEFSFGRHGKDDKRQPKDVCIHAVRGGTIVGEHEVLFCGNNETITLSHSAQSKEVFAVGAIKAGKFIANKSKGMFNMNDIIKEMFD